MLHVGSFINCLKEYISLSETGEQHYSSVTQNENSEKISINKSSFTKIIVGAVIAIAVATFFAGFLLGSSSSEPNSNDLVKSDLADQLAALEKKLDDAQAATAQAPTPTAQPSQIQPAPTDIYQVSINGNPIKGDPDAPITIIEFSDFQCPFCARWYTDTLAQVQEDYLDTGKAKLVYRDHPLDSIHPNARPVHIAANCANEQEKFWDYHDILFERQAEWNRLSAGDLDNQIMEYATTLELDTQSFETCLSSQEIIDEINVDIADSLKVGATGTPTFFIGTEEDGFKKLPGAQPFFAFKNTIDPLLRG